MKTLNLAEELKGNSYPGRGIVIGKTPDGAKAVTAYFITVSYTCLRAHET